MYNTSITDKDLIKFDNKAQHYNYNEFNFADKILMLATFIFPIRLVDIFFRFGKNIHEEYVLIKRYNTIISAPGGSNLGIYKDWRYLWRIYVAAKLQKNIAVYSISFGPLDPKNILFNSCTKWALKHVKFLSIRDKKSQKYADAQGINYFKSIDTAFLNNQSNHETPNENLPSDNYVVVVPNELNKWHVNYQKVSEENFLKLYISIINFFVNKKINVILLPQMFGSENDACYFEKIRDNCSASHLVKVIEDFHSSDYQQQLIKQAKFLVGARYHTMIFSVNNKKPFLSLAYEHKMTNTLELLELTKNNVNINDALNNVDEFIGILDQKYSEKENFKKLVTIAQPKAENIATETFEEFCKTFL